MKKQFLLLLLSSFSISIFAQNHAPRFSIYGGFGFQQYAGDLGNGLYRFNSTEYGVASLGIERSISKSWDLKLFGTLGDLGFCQVNRAAYIKEKYGEDLEHEHEHDPKAENLNSRMGALTVALQYRFANGVWLPTDSRFSPFLSFGFGLNRITDRMKMECVVPGLYSTIHAGTGFKYFLKNQVFVGYNLNFGFFTSDGLDGFEQGRNDLHMQNSAVVGYSF